MFGLRAEVPARTLVWDVRLLDAFGVARYPFGNDAIDVAAASRGAFDEAPRITVRTAVPLDIDMRWGRRSTADGGFRPDRSDAAAGVLRQATHRLRPDAPGVVQEFVFAAGDASAAPAGGGGAA